MDPEQLKKKVNLEKDETYLESHIEDLNEVFREHILHSVNLNKDLFEHWKKPKWDEYFISMAILISMRSVDPSQKNGCVIVDNNNKVLSIGYNGFPRGSKDHLIPLTRPEKYLFIEHAEKNAILNKQFDITNSTLYVTGFPCLACIRSIIQSGIKRVVCEKRYHQGMESEELFKDAEYCGVEERVYKKLEEERMKQLINPVRARRMSDWSELNSKFVGG